MEFGETRQIDLPRASAPHCQFTPCLLRNETIQLAHLSGQLDQPSAKSWRILALEYRKQFDADAIALMTCRRIGAVRYVVSPNRVEICGYFLARDAEQRTDQAAGAARRHRCEPR